ncbi:MAG: ribonuclease Z [Candidatus Woesearchaeota archaeon]
MLDIIFLGTASMVPTAERNHSGVLLTYRDEGILVDCGEGIQRQLRIAGISPTKITKLLISHLHGDHVLGIPGLMQSMAANNYNKTLEIYGPEGTAIFINKVRSTFILEGKIDVKVVEVKNKRFVDTKYFALEAMMLRHTAPCLGYSFIEKDRININVKFLEKFGLKSHPILKELQMGKDIKWKDKIIKAKDATIVTKGKKVTIITDTGLCKDCYELAKDSDLLICESTYDEEMEEKAKEYRHLSSNQAAEIAKTSKSKKLILTHFSQRYKTVAKLKSQAKKIFKNVECAKDFMKISL